MILSWNHTIIMYLLIIFVFLGQCPELDPNKRLLSIFLTVVTRHYKRSEYFVRNTKTLNLEQIFASISFHGVFVTGTMCQWYDCWFKAWLCLICVDLNCYDFFMFLAISTLIFEDGIKLCILRWILYSILFLGYSETDAKCQ